MNDRIRVPQVRVVGADGSQIGILGTDEALKMAQDQDLDLVEVAAHDAERAVKVATAGPPG